MGGQRTDHHEPVDVELHPVENPPQTFTIRRRDQPVLRFSGHLLAEVRKGRFFRVYQRLYRTTKAKYVYEEWKQGPTGRSVSNVAVIERLEEKRLINDKTLDLFELAAKKDTDLNVALYENLQ